MKPSVCMVAFFVLAAGNFAQATETPTISVEHLYYLRTRALDLRKLPPDELIDYCLAQKLGGKIFEDLYSQVLSTRVELIKLQRTEDASVDDPRVKLLNKTYTAYFELLRDEVRRIQNGLQREGQIAADTLEAIARDQR
jgi:hypothetical protein